MRFIKSFKIFEREYWGSCGAGIVVFSKSTRRFLVGFRSGEVMEGHTWGGFGGKLDIDEVNEQTIQDAAIREMQEETEFNGQIELIKGYVFSDGGKFEYHNYIGVIEEEFEPTLNWENDKAKWLTYEELLRLKNKHFGLAKFLRESSSIFNRVAQLGNRLDAENHSY
jgi:8-oxo-dGTP pyrophosphatase MutT (NUDIX family)